MSVLRAVIEDQDKVGFDGLRVHGCGRERSGARVFEAEVVVERL